MFNEEDKRLGFGGDSDEHEPRKVHSQNEILDEDIIIAEAKEDEPEGEEQPREEAPEAKPKKKDDVAKLNQIRREKYQAIHELEQLRKENEELRMAADLSSKSALKYYDENVAKDLEQAKILKMQALDACDNEAVTEADIKIATAIHKMQSVNDYKMQQNMEEEQQRSAPNQQEAYDYEHSRRQQMAQRWTQDNTWFMPNSPDYDNWMANKVNEFTYNLDQDLVNEREEHRILSVDYLEAVDNYVRKLEGERRHNTRMRGNLNMRETRSPVSPVRSEYSSPSETQRPQYTVDPEEIELCKSLGINIKDYLRERIKDEAKQRSKRGY